MFLRRLGKRGTAIVEYAIILAFAAAVGSSFTSDNGMTGSIKSIIGNVNQMLGVAAGKEESNRFKVEDKDIQYADYMNTLIDGLYAKMMSLTNENNPPVKFWIENDGQIKGFTTLSGSYTQLDNVYASDFFPNGSDYAPRGDTCIKFDETGKVINTSNNWHDGVSRLYLKNTKDPSLNTEGPKNNPYEVCLTFNPNTGKFCADVDYWKN